MERMIQVSKKKIKVLIADDHALMRQGLKQILELENNIKIIAQASNGEETIEETLKHKPDVILLDINMPKLNGIEALRRMRSIGIQSKVIILTLHDDKEYLCETVNIGANGYVLKDADSDSLVKAINDVMDGKSYIQPSIANLLVSEIRSKEHKSADEMRIEALTKREYEVLTLIAEGLNNKEIAGRLFISEKTVKNHVSSIFRKIEVSDRIQAAIFSFKNNIKKL